MSGVIKPLTGAVDGSNKDFTAPSAFIADSARVLVNGITYPPDDSVWGYSEIGSTIVRMVTAPTTGFIMQLFYVESESTGSPFDPTGTYP